MKNILLATALIASLSATAVAAAENFEATEVVTSFNSGLLKFSLGTVDGELNTVKTGANVAAYTLGNFDMSTDVSLSYGRLSDTLDLSVDYNAKTAVNPSLTVYGTAGVSYVTPTSDLSAGDAFFEPTLGASYAVAKKADAFAEVSYAWNMSDSWARDGGSVEVGVDYALSETATVTPSLVRTFDTGADTTNLKLELGFGF